MVICPMPCHKPKAWGSVCGMIDQDMMAQYAKFAERLADAASVETLKRFRQQADVYNKAGVCFDPVTDADREAEQVQRQLINAAYPDHGIIGEEFGAENEDATYRWVLDPIDGTRAYVCGVASWTTLISLEVDGVPSLGVIDQPFTEERWLAVGGQLTYTARGKHQKVGVSGCTDIAKARLTTTDPRPAAYFSKAEAQAFDDLAAKVQLVRFSLDAYGYALLAIGELDIVMESGLQLHDYAALGPIVEAAGGVITNWRGDPPGAEGRGEILASASEELHEAALANIARSMPV